MNPLRCLLVLIFCAVNSAPAQQLPIDSATWEGQKWTRNNGAGAYFPTVSAGVATFQTDDYSWGQIRTKTTYTGTRTFSCEILPTLRSGGENGDVAILGITTGWAEYESATLGVKFFNGRVYLYERGKQDVEIGSYSAGNWMAVRLSIASDGTVTVLAGTASGSRKPAPVLSSFRMLASVGNSTDGFQLRAISSATGDQQSDVFPALASLSWIEARPTTKTLRSIYRAGARFVAVGDDGTVIHGLDGITWNLSPFVPNEPGIETRKVVWKSVAGNDSFVVIAADNDITYRTTDFFSWSQVGGGKFSDPNYTAEAEMTGVNGGFLHLTNSTLLSYSSLFFTTDGITWSSSRLQLPGPSPHYSISHNGTLYVSAARESKSGLYTSQDLKIWASVFPDTEGGPVKSVASNGQGFVAVGTNLVMRSATGVTWNSSLTSGRQLTRVRWIGGKYVALDRNGALGESADGATWNFVALPTGFTPVDVAFGASRFVIIGSDGRLFTSDSNSAPQVTVTHSSTGYAAGRNATIEVSLVFASSLSGLGYTAVLPPGWTYSGGTNEPSVKPSVGASGTLDWAWTSVPTSPVSFSFTVSVPSNTSGTQLISGSTTVRTASGASTIAATPTPLSLSALAVQTIHSADTNRDRAINLQELTRVIELFNRTSGTTRTGEYRTQSGTEDGYAPGPGTISVHHTADTNRDGRLSVTELTRVIELFNASSGTSRTGQYRVQAGTEDGFAPGP